MKPKTKKILKIAAISIVALLIIFVCGFYIYTLDYYRADDFAVQTISANPDRIQENENLTVFYPEKQPDRKTGLIFYPGGKVEAIAYAPLLKTLSQNGITCILVEMPFNLAVFNINAADRIYAKFPEIGNWYLAGHSLGGAMASSYAGKNSDKINGLILLGAYPINDDDLPVLAIFGSEDIQLDRSKLEGVQNKLQIAGGNHAFFGNYGEQKGDGTALITREEQQAQTVDVIITFIKQN